MKKAQELSLKSILIGVILAIILCGANMYLGLKIGSTISASIPASILSLGILRMFKKYSILENNISQTIASSGEALAGVVIYVFPALLIMGIWTSFPYWQIVVLGGCGGFIGIAYSVLLRKVLLNDRYLPFPEGKAIGKVLLATNSSTSNKSDFRTIVAGISISALINLCQNGFKVLGDSYYKFFRFNNSVVGLGTSFSPAVIGSGFLIGSNAAIGFVGLIIGWGILIPYFSMHAPLKDSHNLIASAFIIWKHYVRPIGVGVFLFSGIATILMMSGSIVAAIKESIHALKNITEVDAQERDLSIKKMMYVVALCVIPIAILLYNHILTLGVCGEVESIVITVFVLLLVLLLGFIIAAVAGYMVGMVGSSNSPISGLYFIAVIVLCLILDQITGKACAHDANMLMETITLLVAFIGFSAVITNENIQDYKSGQMVGAAPYKQQISLFIGVGCAILLAPIMINLIFNAYGIAGVVPHPGIDPNSTLSAPQASAIAMVTKSMIDGSASWKLLIFGITIGAVAFIIDLIGKKTGKYRFSPVMLGMGLYLPPDLVSGLFVGGILSIIVKRRHKKLKIKYGDEVIEKLDNKSNILVCGLIAGESIMGLVLAIPFVIKQSSDVLRLVGEGFTGISQILSLLVTIAIILAIYKISTRVNKDS